MREDIRAALERAEHQAVGQFGLLRYDEARRCGLSRETVRRLVRDRRWRLAMRSVFSVTTGDLEPARRRAAAVLSLRPLESDEHPPVALHGVSALQQWGVPVSHPSTELVRLVVPHEFQPGRRDGAAATRSRDFGVGDVVVRAGLPVTRIERAVADATIHIRRYDDFVAVMAAVVQSGRTTVERLQLESDTRPRQPGNALLRRALRAVSRGDRSVAEAALAELIDAADVPSPDRLTVLQTSIGPVIPDFLWPHLGLYAEVDGREWHLTPEDWQHDLERQNALAELGLTPLRYPAGAVLRRGNEVIAKLEAELRRRLASIARPVPSTRDVG